MSKKQSKKKKRNSSDNVDIDIALYGSWADRDDLLDCALLIHSKHRNLFGIWSDRDDLDCLDTLREDDDPTVLYCPHCHGRMTLFGYRQYRCDPCISSAKIPGIYDKNKGIE